MPCYNIRYLNILLHRLYPFQIRPPLGILVKDLVLNTLVC